MRASVTKAAWIRPMSSRCSRPCRTAGFSEQGIGAAGRRASGKVAVVAESAAVRCQAFARPACGRGMNSASLGLEPRQPPCFIAHMRKFIG
ncbi:hypothetical protein GCM10010440_72510 [Kitasatospora cinereorecta]